MNVHRAHFRVGALRRSRPGLRAALVLGLLLMGAPGAAWAEDPADGESQEDDAPSAADRAAGIVVTRAGAGPTWNLSADLSTFVGQGVFASGYGKNGTVVSQLAVAPSLSLGSVVLFASQAMQWEYTKPDNINGRRVAVFDTTLGAQYPLRFDSLNLRVALSGGLRLPVSFQSRAQGSIGGLFGGATAIWNAPVPGLRLSMGIRGQLNTSVASLRATGSVDEGPSLAQEAVNCLTRGGEAASDACGVVPNVANLSGQLQVAYTKGKWTGSIGMSVLSFVSAYAGPDDEFTPAAARTGVNARTFSSGSVQVNYSAADFMLVSAGISSFQPIQTANGQGMRFPFWNVNGVANGFSSVQAGTTFFF